jgi:7-cyano-7-deazaguanine synthase
MSIVTLVSGGLDSTLIALLTHQMGVEQYPLFIDYGQKAKSREWAACQEAMQLIGLPEPEVAELPGFGKLVPSGLTNQNLDVLNDAFTPGRNTLFLLAAAAYAVRKNADSIAIGLLHEKTCIFSDQTDVFLRQAEILIAMSVGTEIKILTPLRDFRKQDVVELAQEKGIRGTYSCHAGGAEPCGNCIACNEFKF